MTKVQFKTEELEAGDIISLQARDSRPGGNKMTKFKVGSLIRTMFKTPEGEIVDCEGIIVKYWTSQNGHRHNISLFVTFDREYPTEINSLIDYRGFHPDRWVLLSDVFSAPPGLCA